MFKLESKNLQREFKVIEGSLFASQIINTESGMKFIPDGNGSEFAIRFADGDEFSSKGLQVTESAEKDGKLFFRFKETMGTTVTMSYRVSKNNLTIEKQLAIKQREPKVIDYIALENIGIINSASSFTVPEGESEIDNYYSNLGQPFYIDSLFFGCEFPATKNIIEHGRGQILYYVGKSVEDKLICPTTVMGGAKGSSLTDLKNAFFDYIKSIALPADIRIQYNSWYDRMMNIDANNIQKSFYNVEKQLSSHGVPPIDGYVIDDGWNNYRGDFWAYNQNDFPNGFLDASHAVKAFNSQFGLWLGPRGGYSFNHKFAKRIEKGGFGYFNMQANDICVASAKYLDNLEKFLVKTTKENDIDYWKLDGFCLKPCTNPNHDHITGGENEMYEVTEMWHRWIKIFRALHTTRAKLGKKMWINMTCYVSPSPWWLQYVNSIWLQHSNDIGFADNYPAHKQAQVDSELTYRDSIYYDFLVTRGLQFPLSNIYNHEPIYGYEAKLDYTDEEFEKAFYWNACRGSALAELYLSDGMMNDRKWQILSDVLSWQKHNYHILKNAMFLGGNPAENNIYCYASWAENGEGIIALRNPTNESASLTLTLNKLMGCPETLKNVKRYNVYNKNTSESDATYKYNDKINVTLAPFEVKILQFGEKDNRYPKRRFGNEFTISFDYDGKDGLICQNNDIMISIEKGKINANVGVLSMKSESIISGTNHKITLVREKSRMLKIYIDNSLDCSGFNDRAKENISTELTSSAENFKVVNTATPYNQIITLADILKRKKKQIRKEAGK
ncbi:MAG: hypothetical protein HFJ99_01295 [Eubacterium sp.]|jgi:hypothetical protein|nr:hypothetical protein [Eubacterium sp.]